MNSASASCLRHRSERMGTPSMPAKDSGEMISRQRIEQRISGYARCMRRVRLILVASVLWVVGTAHAECRIDTGRIEVNNECVCPEGTILVGIDERCMPICPPSRKLNCWRHDIERNQGRLSSLPVDFCDCFPNGKNWDVAVPPKMSHCAPFTGEVLRNGDCVCPEGQRYYRVNGFWRCRPPCEAPKEWDCSRQLISITLGQDISGTPDAFCTCESPAKR